MATIRISNDGPVCTIALAVPDKLNPLGSAVRSDLDAALAALRDDGDCRVVLLRGEGRVFSAGADLEESPPTRLGWAERRRAAGGWQRTLDALESLPQVTVARLHGWVVGGAVLLAAACDIRIAASDTRFSVPELHLGIPLTWAGLPRLVREIGLPRTRDLVMTGRTIDSTEALSWGLVTRLASADQLDASVATLLDQLASMPAAALAMTRECLTAIGRSTVPPALAWADADLIAWSLGEPDMQAAAKEYVRRLRNP